MLSLLKTLRRIAVPSLHVSRASAPSSGPTDPSPAPREPGESWGSLILRGEIARGAFGEVYRAWDPALDREVALKLLGPQETAAASHGLVEEGRLLARLRHPNIATVFGADVRDGRAGIWMEFIQGRTLSAIVEADGPFSAREAALIGISVCGAVAAVHAAGLLHRDIKAQNVIRESGGRIVLVDFGLGHDLRGPHSLDLAGTPLYMAPELLRGQPANVRTDVYALGVLLFFLACGTFPLTTGPTHDGGTGDPLIPGSRRGLRDLRPDLSPALLDLVDQATAVNPVHRPPSAAALIPLLTPILHGSPWKPVTRRLAVSLAGSAIAAAALWRYMQSRRFLHAGPGALLVIGPISNLTGDPELDAVPIALRQALLQSSHLNVVEQERILAALNRMVRKPKDLADPNVIREIALREGAPLVVFGNLSLLGQDYALQLKLERTGSDPSSSSGVDSRWLASDKRALLSRVDSAAGWIRDQAGESPAEIQRTARPSEDVTTSSWRALQLYGQADDLAAQGKTEDAVGLWKEALGLDPDFAMACARIGDIRLGHLLFDEGEEWWNRALKILDKRRLVEREALRIRAVLAGDRTEYAESERLYRTFVLRYPNDWFARLRHALVLDHFDGLQEGLADLRVADRVRPGAWQVHYAFTGLFFALGDYPSALHHAGELRRLGKEEWALSCEALAAFLTCDLGKSRQLYARLDQSDNPYWRGRTPVLWACMESELGRYSFARDLLDRTIARDIGAIPPLALAFRHIAKAWTRFHQGQVGLAAADLAAALAVSRDAETRYRAGVLYARSGLLREAAELKATFPLTGRFQVNAVAPHRLAGEIALSAGRAAEALSHFERAAAHEPPSRQKEYIARALASAGSRDQSIAAYRVILDRPGRLCRNLDLEYPGIWMQITSDFVRTAAGAPAQTGVEQAKRLFQQYRREAEGPPAASTAAH